MKVERIEISKLIGDPANVRKHGERNIQTIVASLHRFGQQKPIVIDKHNVVRAGNGTLEAARSMGWTHLDCVRTSLEGGDAVAYSIADNRTAELAEWDDDLLAAQLNGLLTEDEELFKAAGFDENELAALLDEIELDGEGITNNPENPYTRKIEAPIYEPIGECPPITELTDKTKAIALVKEVKAAKLPKEVETFLIDAATRHTVFNFEKIAEFYCHADAKVQDLMERSACVIIDFDKAIENGYISLSEEVSKQYAKEYPDAE